MSNIQVTNKQFTEFLFKYVFCKREDLQVQNTARPTRSVQRSVKAYVTMPVGIRINLVWCYRFMFMVVQQNGR